MAEKSISVSGGLLERRGKVAKLVSLAWTGNVWLLIVAVLSVCHEWQSEVPNCRTESITGQHQLLGEPT
jgi:hypothetical protein